MLPSDVLRELVDALFPLIEKIDSQDRYLRAIGKVKTIRIKHAYQRAVAEVEGMRR